PHTPRPGSRMTTTRAQVKFNTGVVFISRRFGSWSMAPRVSTVQDSSSQITYMIDSVTTLNDGDHVRIEKYQVILGAGGNAEPATS
uniref:hypothetical protein n=1 Tax=Rhodococcus sp. O3 TaxID=3404919 RepID=UPI003B681395